MDLFRKCKKMYSEITLCKSHVKLLPFSYQSNLRLTLCLPNRLHKLHKCYLKRHIVCKNIKTVLANDTNYSNLLKE